jgi:hypothetical protein
MNLQIIATTVMWVSILGLSVGVAVYHLNELIGKIIIYGLLSTTAISMGILLTTLTKV